MKLLFLLIGTLISSFALGNTVDASVAVDSSNGVVLRAVDYLPALNHFTGNKPYKPPIAVPLSRDTLAGLIVTQPADFDPAFAVNDTAYSATTGAPVVADLLTVEKQQILIDNATDSLEWRGKQDAKMYFRRSEVAVAACVATFGGLFTSGSSLVVPVALAIVPPTLKANDVPDPGLLQNQAYRRGYQQEAAKRKRLQVLKGTGLGALSAGIVVGVVYLTLASIF